MGLNAYIHNCPARQPTVLLLDSLKPCADYGGGIAMFADVHHHILYGLDDGARTEEEMLEMLKAAADDGTKYIAATPHISLETCPFPMEEYTRKIKKAQEICAENSLDIVLCSGAEILYSDGIVNTVKRGEIPTLGNTDNVLLEFFEDVSFTELENAVRSFTGKGYHVVIAHAERYSCLGDVSRAKKLRTLYPVKYQVNAATVANGGQGIRQKIWLKKMLGSGLIDIVASDAHSTGHRRTRMKTAHGWLLKNFGDETADRLCSDNPLQILGLT